MEKIIIVGASVLQLPAIQKAKEMGFYVVVIDINPNAVGVKYADAFYNISTVDTVNILRLAKKIKPVGIMTIATDQPMRAIAEVTKKLGLPGISTKTALRATDKSEMIKAFQKNKVDVPWFYVFHRHIDFLNYSFKLTFPCIMKPTTNSGSRGVVLINHPDKLFDSYEYSKNNAPNGAVIVEEYLQGHEVSVEVIVIDKVPHVIQVTDKLTTGAPHFVEMGHCQPSCLNENDVEEIKALACRAAKAIELDCGPAHVEIILTKNGPKMVEIGARLGGDCITSHLVPLSTGVDMVEASIMLATGKTPDINQKFNKGAAIRYFNIPEGKITAIEGVEKAKEIQGVKDIVFTKNVGDKISKVTNSSDRIGFVIAQAENPNDAIEICNEAINTIDIKVDKDGFRL